MIIESRHRNYNLALRHLAALRREYPHAELLSRRRADGRFSNRGQFYQFEVREAETGKGIEFVAHFDYGGGKKRNLITFQLHIFAPEGTTDDEALQAIRDRANGQPWPSRQWQSRMLEYQSGVKPFRKNAGANKLPQGLVNTGVAGGEGSIVSRRDSVRSNRRGRRKAK